jgi:hypothetical protein
MWQRFVVVGLVLFMTWMCVQNSATLLRLAAMSSQRSTSTRHVVPSSVRACR